MCVRCEPWSEATDAVTGPLGGPAAPALPVKAALPHEGLRPIATDPLARSVPGFSVFSTDLCVSPHQHHRLDTVAT